MSRHGASSRREGYLCVTWRRMRPTEEDRPASATPPTPCRRCVRSSSCRRRTAGTQRSRTSPGNSLGLQPAALAGSTEPTSSTDWARLGVEGHGEAAGPWVSYHELLRAAGRAAGRRAAREVVVMNSLTVNLHLMMASFYRPTRASGR